MNTQTESKRKALRRTRRVAVWAGTILATAVVLTAGFLRFREWYLPNFRVLRPVAFYRSGQPRGPGLQAIKLMGIRTVITLRSKRDSAALAEETFCRNNSIQWVRVPLGGTQADVSRAVSEIMAIVEAPRNRPVLVHCARGKERSGLVSAVFRIEQERWANAKALKEMYDLGLEPGSWPTFEGFIWEYRPKWRNEEEVDASSAESRTDTDNLPPPASSPEKGGEAS